MAVRKALGRMTLGGGALALIGFFAIGPIGVLAGGALGAFGGLLSMADGEYDSGGSGDGYSGSGTGHDDYDY